LGRDGAPPDILDEYRRLGRAGAAYDCLLGYNSMGHCERVAVTTLTPLFASARTAARLLDMSVAEFQRLVAEGALPGPCMLDRWHVPELERIMRGDAARYGQRLEL
jgi:hypothetical protein